MKAQRGYPQVNGIEQLDLANQLAQTIHGDQPYGNGPRSLYEGHLLPVAELVVMQGYGSLTAAAALLHDGIEDGIDPATGGPITEAWLIDRGVYAPLAADIGAMSLRTSERYDDYMQRLQNNDRAKIIKRADSILNMANTVLTASTEGIPLPRRKKRLKKYIGNIVMLQAVCPEPDELYEGEGMTIGEVIQLHQDGMPPKGTPVPPRIWAGQAA